MISIFIESCSTKDRKEESDPDIAANHAIQQPQSTPETPKILQPTGDPEKDWILVEQAVDAWLYFHLSDFKSYQPLIRSNEYDAERDVYLHHLRYRIINEQGGPVTLERDFEVDLNRPGDHGNPFKVTHITSRTPSDK